MKFIHIRHALEAAEKAEAEQTTNVVTIKGPLSNLYTEILHCLYKKSDAAPQPPATDLDQYSQGSLVLANESEAKIRQAVEGSASELLAIDTALAKPNSAIATAPTQTMIYAISPSGVSNADVKAIINEKIEADQNNYRFAVVAPDVIISQGVHTRQVQVPDTPDQVVTVQTQDTLLDAVDSARVALETLQTKYGIEVISMRSFMKDCVF